ncbi:uncharacterized protein LOC116932046 [Daphnia magna]|nr:uncharacterized protein LOC116932046 [Daphnia magna]KAK4003261.1 hypothetical protein OUZ56_005035 [Daphnia magna]
MAAQIDKGVVDGRASRCDPDETNPTPKVINNHCIKQTIRKIKPIPPPLDLSKRGPLDLTSSESVSDFTSFSASPRSPASSNQKHLPFRKRAFSWTTFHDEAGCNSLSPGPSSAIMQRSTYYGFIPTSPHISRLSVIKQESIDQPDVFGDYYLSSNVEGKEVQESVAIGKSSKEKPCVYSEAKTVITYPAPQSPAFPTPATPSPLSPMNFPPTSTFFPPHFHPKLSSYSWSGSLLSPAPSLHSSSQEELAQCRSWKLEENEMEEESSDNVAASREESDAFHGGALSREDYVHSEPQPGTSELCERLQRFDFVMPPAVPKSTEKRYQVTNEETSSSLAPSPAKRPMNGFMLFAQKYRLQLIQQFPGRDNRAISVMLGDAWKRLNPGEKEVYTAEAHLRAEEYRRLFPDCWKRKRSKSTS